MVNDVDEMLNEDTLLTATSKDDEDEEEDSSSAATASLYCSVPLNRDVQSIIDTFAKSEGEKRKARKLACLYCERTFVADSLRQKHVERCHSVKQARRSSSRIQSGSTQQLQCLYCNTFQPNDSGLSDLFQHMVREHADRYFACGACCERFVLKSHLDEHQDEAHGLKSSASSRLALSSSANGISNDSGILETIYKDACNSKSGSVVEEIIDDGKELRGKRVAIKSTKLGIKRSARLQNKEVPQQPNGKQKKKAKVKQLQPDVEELGERGETVVKVAPHENPYPSFDAFYRVKKITDHSIDNLRITSLTFNDVFDQAFYTRIKCNIADNLMNHIDGKLFKNEASESRISNFEKEQTETHYGCEISLNAATPVVSFLAPQLGDDPEAQIEYGSKASKKKTKPDEVHYKYFTRRKYQASIQEIKENRDLSKLDMWTQYVIKNRQQAIANMNKTEKERVEYRKGDEHKAKLQNEELNRILDRRGPFEDLKEEANKQAVRDGNARREARVEVSAVLEDILHSAFDLSRKEHEVRTTELTDAEIPDYLNLRKASPAGDRYVDRSDKITLICSSEETENFEVPQVSPRDKNALAELTGEWTRSRLFICAACGMRLGNMRELLDHKSFVHGNVWCQHYEFVGNQGAYYSHLSIPGLGKIEQLEKQPVSKAWVRSDARICTKCKKQCNTLGELHRHVLECGEDWSWMLIRKKCKYRPFGAKTRRKRRGLIKRQISKEKAEGDGGGEEKKRRKRREGPRVKPSDAETIQRMLANLPAKRATRKIMSLKDGFPKANRKKQTTTQHIITETTDQVRQDKPILVKRKMIVANKCNPVANLRKSVRNINKVISSALIDNKIMMRRKVKAALHVKRAAGNDTALAPPIELTEEQRAEEVKKKISLLKKAQNLRRSVIKRRTTKKFDGVGADATNSRKTRSTASISTDDSRDNKEMRSAPTKKVCKNFGAKFMHNINVRLKTGKQTKSKVTDKIVNGATGTISGNKRKSKLGNIKDAVVKKLKVCNSKKALNSKQTQDATGSPINCVQLDSTHIQQEVVSLPTTLPSSTVNDHFLEESSREDAIKTIGEVILDGIRDNDNRPVYSESTCDKTTEIMHQSAITDDQINMNLISTDNSINQQIEQPMNLTCKDKQLPCGETTKCSSDSDLTLLTPKAMITKTNVPPVYVDHLVESCSKSKFKSKLCKRTKGLNDCIAMLTSKLTCKNDNASTFSTIPAVTTTVFPGFPENKSNIQQQRVTLSTHDTSTEEQNVVIPEETVSMNLESAKEPEAAPSDDRVNGNDVQLSTPTAAIEHDKENIELDQKRSLTLPPAMQTFDIIDKVADFIKCLDGISSKDTNADATAVLEPEMPSDKQGSKQKKKIGGRRRITKKSSVNVVHINRFQRKIGVRRHLPQRKSKTAVNLYESPVQEYNWEVHDKDTIWPENNLQKTRLMKECVQELPTILECMESSILANEFSNCVIKHNHDLPPDKQDIVPDDMATRNLAAGDSDISVEKSTSISDSLQPQVENEGVLKTTDLPVVESITDSEDELPLAKLAKHTAQSNINNILSVSDKIIVPLLENDIKISESENPSLSEQSDNIGTVSEKVKSSDNNIERELNDQEIVTTIVENLKPLIKRGERKQKRERKTKKAESENQTYVVEGQTIMAQLNVPEESKEVESETKSTCNRIDKDLLVSSSQKIEVVKHKQGRKPKAKTKSGGITTTKLDNDKPGTGTSDKSELGDKLPISVYDFDEDDDAHQWDNSKENVEHKKLSPKSLKGACKHSSSSGNKRSSVKGVPKHEDQNTPLKDMQNESFIQTPDLNDSGLVNKLKVRFKVKKCGRQSGKIKKQLLPPLSGEEAVNYCHICNKQFMRLDSLTKHKRTLTHIAKLSEIEALEAAEKNKAKEKEAQESQEVLLVNNAETHPGEMMLDDASNEKQCMDKFNIIEEGSQKFESPPKLSESAHFVEDTSTLSCSNTQTLSLPVANVANSMIVPSPFSIKTNNDSLKLADIICDVLNKPVKHIETYSTVNVNSETPEVSLTTEMKRCKSLGERKSFDSDTCNPTSSYSNISPASTLINRNKSNEFIKNQLSLLENIIEINRDSFEYLEEVSSVNSIASSESDRCPSDMSFASDIKPAETEILSSKAIEKNFIPSPHQVQYEEISEDSMNNRTYDQDRSRKTLNRDEELFLECCSLLKSSSELRDFNKKSLKNSPFKHDSIVKHQKRDGQRWAQHQRGNLNEYFSDSCPNTPIGNVYEDLSNSDTVKTDWNAGVPDAIAYEDISESSEDDHQEIGVFRGFDLDSLPKSDLDESSSNGDFRKNINARFGDIMAEALKRRSTKSSPKQSRGKLCTPHSQASIIDYAVQLTPKSASNSTDSFTDLTNDSRRMLTKGAMKVFEGLKVSIPTDHLDMSQLLSCSPISKKRLELEEVTKVSSKSKSFNFGNKLGMKVTKKRSQRIKPSEDHVIGRNKLHDVYDFEETQDNTDLFTKEMPVLKNEGSAYLSVCTLNDKLAKLIDSESESNNQDIDSFAAEAQSLNSFSTETESRGSNKPMNSFVEQKNITKKKCVIMGRIFRNAFKAKTDDVKENDSEIGMPKDSYIIGPSPKIEQLAAPVTERTKMSEKEMDLLFDTLLHGTRKSEDINEVILSVPVKGSECKESRNGKTKKSLPSKSSSLKCSGQKKRARKASAASDDEFNLSKMPKNRQSRKSNKEKDNAINLEQELKECMGVASRKSQRKCTSGKQNVLIEDWSSDDSEFEAMLRISMEEMKTTSICENILESITHEPKIQTLNVTSPDADEVEKQGKEIGQVESKDADSIFVDEQTNIGRQVSMNTSKARTKRLNGYNNACKTDSNYKLTNVQKPSKLAKRTKSIKSCDQQQEPCTPASSNRRKRAAAETLYYWSSSSEDDTQNLIEVKSFREEIDDDEDRPQHGWIVGDSPKKLVTLLAHAKGKKTCNR